MSAYDGAIWHTEPAQAALASGDPGAIVRAMRKANQLTLEQLAARCGYSASTLSRLETGRQLLRDVGVLRSLAHALGIPPQVLGLADTPPGSDCTAAHTARVGLTQVSDEETESMRRRMLLAGLTGVAGSALLGLPTARAVTSTDPIASLERALLNPPMRAGRPLTLTELRRVVASTHAEFQRGRYVEVAAMMPNLVSTAMATRAELGVAEEISVANQHLADLYTLTSELMIKVGRDDLAGVTANRALEAACASGDVLAEASARRAWAIVLRRAGHGDIARQLVIDTATRLHHDLRAGAESLAVYGSLLSTAAYTAAVDGNRDVARDLIGDAADAAGRLGDGNHRYTVFGPTMVRLYQVNIARVLGDFGAAIEHARAIDPATIPTDEQRARFWANNARSFHAWGKPDQCFRALLAAERAAADEVRHRKPIQQITTSLLQHPTANRMPGLRDFARRTGVRLYRVLSPHRMCGHEVVAKSYCYVLPALSTGQARRMKGKVDLPALLRAAHALGCRCGRRPGSESE